MFRRIFIPLDGSERAASVLPLAARLARASLASLCLMRVVATSASDSWGKLEETALCSDLIKKEQQRVQMYLQDLASSPELSDLSVIYKVAVGEPAQAILDGLQEYQADLLLMCSHGSSDLRRWTMGSIAHKVARYCPVPTLILHEREQLPFNLRRQEPGRVRVLVPLDGSALAEEALLPALKLSQALSAPSQASLHLLSVLPSREIPPTTETAYEELRAEVEAYLVRMEEQVKQEVASDISLLVTSSLIKENDIASTIVDFSLRGILPIEPAIERGCDLIALTTHGRSGVSSWLMGNVAERVLDTTRMPLFLIRPGAPGLLKKGGQGLPARGAGVSPDTFSLFPKGVRKRSARG